MKKIFTILAIATASTSAFAQITHDISVTFASHIAGTTVSTAAVADWNIVVKN